MHPKTKYWIYALFLIILAALAVAEISYRNDQKRVKELIVENLLLNHELSASSFAENFSVLNEEVRLLAGTERIRNYLNYDETKKNTYLESEFIQWAQNSVKHFGFYDFFIVNARGDVIFTVAREKDLGTNLINGPFKSSGLGRLFSRVRSTGESALIDFSVYEPSNNKIAAFLGAPVFIKDKFSGVVAIQLNPYFKELNIGVHLEVISDYLVTSNYIFRHEGSFKSLDSLKIPIPREHQVVMRNDSLFLFTSFDLGSDIHWGVLSVAPPVVVSENIQQNKIWFYVILSVLLSMFISVLIISRLSKKGKGFNYAEGEIILVQNTWHQFIQTKQSFGTDFYYRLKNKLNIKLGDKDADIEITGKNIENQASEMISALNDKSEIHERLSFLAAKCLEFNIPASKLLKLPDLFIESIEDEMKKEIHFRAKTAWERILTSLVYQLVGLLKEKAK